ncbi:MAG: methyltransferase domain-containing protein [Firmicutes bacterium]|nr:methyltransferase domain-containing protein [Bacillota bacterium]
MSENKEFKEFPRSKKYDFKWMCKNEMGPNSIWLTEFLTKEMDLKPGMKVLDIGCGMAMSSIFLAKEFGVEVWATDLWISATDNLKRIKKEGLEDQIYPIYADVHSLPFPYDFFDAIVSIDSYHYFGTDEIFFLEFSKYLKSNGQIGIVVPGLLNEFDNVPNELRDVWDNEFYTFHSIDWWRKHLEKTGLVKIEKADTLPNSWDIWMKWEKILKESGLCKRNGDTELLLADNGKYLTFPRLIARKKV